MKKNLAIAMLLSVSAFMNAQNNQENTNTNSNSKPISDSKISFGVKGGYSLSSMKFFDEKLDSKSYFYAGVVVEQPITSKFSVQAEALYTQIGGKQNFPVVDFTGSGVIEKGSVEFDYQLTQIQIPVSAKYYFIPNLSASVGMNFGINMSEKVKTDQVVNGSTSQDYEGVKTLNLFPFLGAEYKITENISVDARYNFNFIQINQGNPTTKVGFLQAGVGYRFK